MIIKIVTAGDAINVFIYRANVISGKVKSKPCDTIDTFDTIDTIDTFSPARQT